VTAVEIEYCHSCGFLDRAEEIQHALLSGLGEQLDRVALVVGEKGVLRVGVDGSEGDEIVFDKDDDEYDVDEIVRRVRDRT
jgi:selenoprotein W-related protein